MGKGERIPPPTSLLLVAVAKAEHVPDPVWIQSLAVVPAAVYLRFQ